MKISVKENNYDIVEFYDEVAKQMGYEDTSNLGYDCTKINIAANIQDGFYEYYMSKAEDVPESEMRAQVSVLLLMSGPKVDSELVSNMVEVFDGFIIDNGNNEAV